MPPETDRFEANPDRQPLQAIVEKRAAAIVAAAIRALIDDGAIQLPTGTEPSDIQVFEHPADPPRVTITLADRSKTFAVSAQADDLLSGLPQLLEREGERTANHLNELLGTNEPTHPQW